MKRKAGETGALGKMLIKQQLKEIPSCAISQVVHTDQGRVYAGGGQGTILYVKAKYTQVLGLFTLLASSWKEEACSFGRRKNVLLGLSPLSRCSKPF